MAITDVTGLGFVAGVIGSLQGAIGYPVVNATNGIIGLSLTPTADRFEIDSNEAITGIGSAGETATFVSEADLGWTGIVTGA